MRILFHWATKGITKNIMPEATNMFIGQMEQNKSPVRSKTDPLFPE
jgi:hypothetical protein